MRRISFYLVIISCFTWVGCEDNKRREYIKAELVEIGVKKYIADRNTKCRDEAYLEADRIVDSMMLDQAFFTKIDTFIKPHKPSKPEMPPIKALKDTDPVGPILHDFK